MNRFFGALASSATAALCVLLLLFLAWHHPLAPALALLGSGVLAVLAFRAPLRWAWWVFPLLPLAGWMSWTGWLAVEEFDLVVLAVAAGGHARIAWGQTHGAPALRRLPRSWRWLLLLAAATVLAVVRGVLDAGGDDFGWWQGYRDPTNSLRLAKGVLAALLLLPLMRAAWRVDQATASWRLEQAMTGMLAVTGLVVLWERLAFTGLWDLGSDYRATGLFWEAHLGGSALQAVLVVGMPFGAAALVRAATLRAALFPLAALALGAYACVVSFSRVAYLAVPLGLLIWWLLPLGRMTESRQPGQARPYWLPPLVLLGFGALAFALFPGSGWPGLLALLGALLLMLPLQGLSGVLPRAQVALALLLGLLPALAMGALAGIQGANAPGWVYGLFALLWCTGAGLLWWARQQGWPACALPALACCVGVLAALPAFAWLQGGAAALPAAAWAAELLLVLLLWMTLRQRPWWPLWLMPAARRAGWLAALVLVLVLSGVAAGRLAVGQGLPQAAAAPVLLQQLQQDLRQQWLHWQRALGTLQDPMAWLLGHGAGRFAAQLQAVQSPGQLAAELRWQPGPGGQAMAVLATGGQQPGEPGLRLLQRVTAPEPAADGRLATLRLTLNNPQPLGLAVTVCAQNMHHTRGCAGAQRALPAAAAGSLQQVELPLRGLVPPVGPWFAQRPLTFALALDAPGQRIELHEISLVDGAGRELLGNRGFEQGLAYWYTGSEHQHQPWHAQNLLVHLLVEQGLVGLLVWLLVLGGALWRLLWGDARHRSLAPPLAAGLLTLLVLGAVDSLLDMPRVAFLASWLLALGLALPGGRRLPGPDQDGGRGGTLSRL